MVVGSLEGMYWVLTELNIELDFNNYLCKVQKYQGTQRKLNISYFSENSFISWTLANTHIKFPNDSVKMESTQLLYKTPKEGR